MNTFPLPSYTNTPATELKHILPSHYKPTELPDNFEDILHRACYVQVNYNPKANFIYPFKSFPRAYKIRSNPGTSLLTQIQTDNNMQYMI